MAGAVIHAKALRRQRRLRERYTSCPGRKRRVRERLSVATRGTKQARRLVAATPPRDGLLASFETMLSGLLSQR